MSTPLYNTDIIPMTSRPTLTVMDDGDYFVILDTSTGKISKILKTLAMEALKITYDNTTSGLTAETVQAALDELVVNLGTAVADLAGAGRTTETVKGNADAVALRELLSNKVTSFQEVPTDAAYPSEKLVDDSLKNLAGTGRTTETVKANADDIISIKGTGYTEGSLKSHEDRLDTLEGTGEGSVAKAIDDGNNRTMAEIMGFAPRNLMTVFGTSTVAATFEALRASVSGGDFSHLRLGDYIDLDTFTVNKWYNGAPYDSANGAWDTTVTVTKNLSYQNTRVEIVGFNDYRYVGNTAYPSSHHVTFQFKNIPLTAPMHKLNVSPYYQTSQGYSGSDLVTIGLAEWYTAIASQFGTATPYNVDRSIATVGSAEWCGAEKLFLPTAMNVFGSPGYARSAEGVRTQTQFPLYALNPNKRMKRRNGSIRQWWWLAEPSAGSSSDFTIVHDYGSLSGIGSCYSIGVAPAFLI